MIETILLANTAEAFERLLNATSSMKEGMRRMHHELSLSQRAFFWGDDHKAVIIPSPIPQVLIDHNQQVCGYSEIATLSLETPKVNLSTAMNDSPSLMDYITQAAQQNPKLVISPYAATDSFAALSRILIQRGVKLAAKEIPQANSLWTVKYLDSKAGFRTEMQKMGAVIPEGFIADSKDQALDIAEWLYAQEKAVAIKANHGESGWGLIITQNEGFLNAVSLREKISRQMANDPVWDNTLIVVEEAIMADMNIAGGSPSTEFYVDERGAHTTYHCGQFLNAQGGFFGVELGKGVLSQRLVSDLQRIADGVGDRYHALGYRGYFDVDFIIGEGGNLYMAETNMRRTGGTHVYDLARHLFGEQWSKEAYLLSHDSFCYGSSMCSPETLLDRLKSLLYPINGEGRGVVVTLMNPWDPIMGYIAIAPDMMAGRRLQQQLFDVFG